MGVAPLLHKCLNNFSLIYEYFWGWTIEWDRRTRKFIVKPISLDLLGWVIGNFLLVPIDLVICGILLTSQIYGIVRFQLLHVMLVILMAHLLGFAFLADTLMFRNRDEFASSYNAVIRVGKETGTCVHNL